MNLIEQSPSTKKNSKSKLLILQKQILFRLNGNYKRGIFIGDKTYGKMLKEAKKNHLSNIKK